MIWMAWFLFICLLATVFWPAVRCLWWWWAVCEALRRRQSCAGLEIGLDRPIDSLPMDVRADIYRTTVRALLGRDIPGFTKIVTEVRPGHTRVSYVKNVPKEPET